MTPFSSSKSEKRNKQMLPFCIKKGQNVSGRNQTENIYLWGFLYVNGKCPLSVFCLCKEKLTLNLFKTTLGTYTLKFKSKRLQFFHMPNGMRTNRIDEKRKTQICWRKKLKPNWSDNNSKSDQLSYLAGRSSRLVQILLLAFVLRTRLSICLSICLSPLISLYSYPCFDR